MKQKKKDNNENELVGLFKSKTMISILSNQFLQSNSNWEDQRIKEKEQNTLHTT